MYGEVTIITDQKSLVWFFSLKTPNEKLQRWALRLRGFRFRYEHRSGALNRDADALSRYAVGQAPPEGEDPVTFPLMSLEQIDLRAEQIGDKICGSLVDLFEGKIRDPSDRLKRLSTGFYLDQGILYYKIHEDGWDRELLVLPKSMWIPVCESIHDDKSCRAHLGYKKCLDIMFARFHFKSIAKFLRRYISSCTPCQTRNLMATTKLAIYSQFQYQLDFLHCLLCQCRTINSKYRRTKVHVNGSV